MVPGVAFPLPSFLIPPRDDFDRAQRPNTDFYAFDYIRILPVTGDFSQFQQCLEDLVSPGWLTRSSAIACPFSSLSNCATGPAGSGTCIPVPNMPGNCRRCATTRGLRLTHACNCAIA
jgi:hypothetical protein